jgi:hypothetical protein
MFWNIFLETLGLILGILVIAMIVYRLVHREEGQKGDDA